MEDSSRVRALLTRLRHKWDAHAPTAPFSTAEELASGVTVADFCVHFLWSQRLQRTRPRPLPSVGLDTALPAPPDDGLPSSSS